MRSRRSLFIFIVTLQCFVMLGLFFNIYEKGKQVKVSVNPLKSDSFELIPHGKFTSFYDPIPQKLESMTVPPGIDYIPQNVSNSDGFNEDREYSIVKNNNTYRIIAIGDSFTYGIYVSSKENWTSVLERALNSASYCPQYTFEVINMGVPAYDNEYSIERFRRKGVKYSPDLVIWLQVEPKRINELIMPTVAAFEKKHQAGKANLGVETGQFRNTVYRQIVSRYGDAKVLEYQKKVIEKIGKYYKSSLLLIPIPHLSNDEKNMLKNVTLGNDQWYYFDGLRKFSVFENDGHPDKKGHKMIGEDIFDFVVSSDIAKCKV